MKAYFRTTILVRLLFIFFTITTFLLDIGASSKIYVVNYSELNTEKFHSKRGLTSVVYFLSIYTTTDEHIRLRWPNINMPKRNDTITVQNNMAGKHVAIYQPGGTETYPIERHTHFYVLFLFFSVTSIISLFTCTWKNYSSMAYVLLFTVLADVLTILFYFIL
jgi:hypothetical protein